MFMDVAAGKNGAMYDVVSGSRYLLTCDQAECALSPQNPPPDRQRINAQITREINDRLGLSLTDSFCGFKAYRVAALERLRLTESGYAFPMQFWVQAVAAGLRITEVPVKLIYNDLNRTFGGPLDDPTIRLSHYLRVLHCELERCARLLPAVALQGVQAGCEKA
jgi:dolichol-phosphate mannosyltransferase